MSEIYGTYTLHAATVLSCESSDFLFSSTEFSAYMVQSWQNWCTLYSASSWSMTSAGPATFFTFGILSSFSSCTVLVSCSSCSIVLRNFRSNSSLWHKTPISSGGSRYVYTCPVLRSNSKLDVLKNSLSVEGLFCQVAVVVLKRFLILVCMGNVYSLKSVRVVRKIEL